MTNKDFTTSIVVDQTPKEVFDAINNVAGWWSGEIKGNTNKLNDEFTYRSGEVHFSKQRIVELVPGKKVVWLVTESQINFVANKNEWANTTISFDIEEQGKKTQVRFTHLGLNPEIECYGGCSNGWNQLIQQSLMSLITTGKGKKIF